MVGSPLGVSYPPAPIQTFELGNINTLFFGPGTSSTVETSAGEELGPVDVTGLDLVGMGVFRIDDSMLPVSARPRPPNTLTAEVSLTR